VPSLEVVGEGDVVGPRAGYTRGDVHVERAAAGMCFMVGLRKAIGSWSSKAPRSAYLTAPVPVLATSGSSTRPRPARSAAGATFPSAESISGEPSEG